ncbi:MAG: hypothetical protein ABSG53_12175 [Thermoguttaceae bacterium]
MRWHPVLRSPVEQARNSLSGLKFAHLRHIEPDLCYFVPWVFLGF